MTKLCKYFIVAWFFSGFCMAAFADDDSVKGDPEILWQSPLNGSKIELNDYTRCQLIKTVIPGAGQTEAFRQKNYELMSEYIPNLYAQSIKIAASLEEEKNSSFDLPAEDKLMEYVRVRIGDIARRINIINSLEAGTTVIEALTALQGLPPKTFEKYENCEGLNQSGGKQ